MFKLLVLAFFIAAASTQVWNRVWNPSSDPEWRAGQQDARCPIPNGPLPTFFHHPSDCAWYYQCNDGFAFPMPCPPALHWNRTVNACDHQENVNCVANNRRFNEE